MQSPRGHNPQYIYIYVYLTIYIYIYVILGVKPHPKEYKGVAHENNAKPAGPQPSIYIYICICMYKHI